MAWWELLAELAGLLLLLVVFYGLALVVRRRWISRRGGTFEFSVRLRTSRPGGGWVLGLARYADDELEWFRIFSLSRRPRLVLARADLVPEVSRDPAGVEAYSLYAGHVVVACATDQGPLEVALSPAALTGFLAWLESAPPGRRLPGQG